MRLLHFLTEADAPSGDVPQEKPKEPEKTPEQEAEEQKVKDIEAIVDKVKAATSKNDLNSAVKVAAPLYKEYGEEWFKQLKKALSVDIVSEIVDEFMTVTRNFSERLIHLKDKTNGTDKKVSKK